MLSEGAAGSGAFLPLSSSLRSCGIDHDPIQVIAVVTPRGAVAVGCGSFSEESDRADVGRGCSPGKAPAHGAIEAAVLPKTAALVADRAHHHSILGAVVSRAAEALSGEGAGRRAIFVSHPEVKAPTRHAGVRDDCAHLISLTWRIAIGKKARALATHAGGAIVDGEVAAQFGQNDQWKIIVAASTGQTGDAGLGKQGRFGLRLNPIDQGHGGDCRPGETGQEEQNEHASYTPRSTNRRHDVSSPGNRLIRSTHLTVKA